MGIKWCLGGIHGCLQEVAKIQIIYLQDAGYHFLLAHLGGFWLAYVLFTSLVLSQVMWLSMLAPRNALKFIWLNLSA